MRTEVAWLWLALGAVLFSGACGGRSASVPVTSSPGPEAGTGCTPGGTRDCSGGGEGFTCPPGDNPETANPTYDCSTPTKDSSGNDEYCCFLGFGDDSSCVSDDQVTADCQSPNVSGFQCDDGDSPESLDPSLDCGAAMPDPDHQHDDYCCTCQGCGSSGVPAGCTADPSIDCVGGADGFACPTGDNPGAAGTAFSCSAPQLDPDGVHDDCCCIPWPYGAASCTPDDDLASACPDAEPYGYQCQKGEDPTMLDSSLTCAARTPDPDGVHTDFCCMLD
jgi:hypothetical protein